MGIVNICSAVGNECACITELNLFCTPDCWLEFSVHPRVSETNQIDHVFQWFPSVLEQLLSWYPERKLCCLLLLQLSPKLTPKYMPKRMPQKVIKTSS
jgi:hypothetical protein